LQGAKAWGEALSKLKRLNSLTVDFSGYSQAKNNVKNWNIRILISKKKRIFKFNYKIFLILNILYH
jgi:hypothetical protein